jgi:hypothetical protein
MAATATKDRPAWMDRYRAPSFDELMAPFNKQNTTIIEHARAKLLAIEGLKEEVSWQGVWRWTLVYRLASDERGWAYLVPNPTKPRIAVPVTDELIAELPMKKLSRLVRDGLVHAPTVDGVRWAQWELQSRTQTDEILSLAMHKLNGAKALR